MENIIYKFIITTRTRSQNQGFVLPIVIGLGIAMVLIAATLMITAQADRINNEAQQTKAKSKSVADAAAAQAINILNDNRILATASSICGDSAYTTDTASKVCWTNLKTTSLSDAHPMQKYIQVCQGGSWVDQRDNIKALLADKAINTNSKSAASSFKINSYTYTVEWADSNGGALTPQYGSGAEINTNKSAVQSQIYGSFDITAKLSPTSSDGNTVKNKQLNELQGSSVRIQFKVRVDLADSSYSIPGIWVNNGTLANDAIASQVWLRDCSVGDDALSTVTGNIVAGKSSLPVGTTVSLSKPYAKFVLADFPTIQKGLRTLTTPNSDLNATDITTLYQNKLSAGGKTANDNQFYNLTSRSSPPSTSSLSQYIDIKSAPNGPLNSGYSCIANKIPVDTLPRPSDASIDTDIDGTGKSNQVFYYDYIVSSLKAQTLTIIPGCQVRLFILGNIDKDSKIVHDCSTAGKNTPCNPKDLQIYGLGSNNSFCFNDITGKRNVLDAFIFAPGYKVGVMNSVVRGALWFNAQNPNCSTGYSSAVMVQQSIKWSELPKDLRPDSAYNIQNVLPPNIGGSTGKVFDWKVCQPDTTYKCDGSAYSK